MYVQSCALLNNALQRNLQSFVCVQCVCMLYVSVQIQIRPNRPAPRGFDYYCEMKQYRGYCLWKLAKWPLYLTAAFADDKD